jgi:2-polyprenyl-6-methoxyphenol hydroxylase-like FAD-dependent oxidoreductase
MTPDLGQGACQAIESALALADAVCAGSDPVAALRRYEQRRYAHTTDVNRMSWLVANSIAASSPTSRWLRDAAIRFSLRTTFMTQLDWLFGAS